MQLQLNLACLRALLFICLVNRISVAYNILGNGWRNGLRHFATMPNEDTASSTSAMTPEADKIASLAELIIKKAEAGSFDELKAAGMKVSTKSGFKQQPVVVPDETTLPFAETDEDLDAELISRLMQDVDIDTGVEAVENLEQQPWFADVESYRQQLLSSSNSDIAKRALSQPPTIKPDITASVGAANELLLDEISRSRSTGGEAPGFVEMFEKLSQIPSINTQGNLVDMGEMEDDLMEFDDAEESGEDELSRLADEIQAAAITDTKVDKTQQAISAISSMDTSSSIEEEKEAEADGLQREMNAATFAELLKASLEDNNGLNYNFNSLYFILTCFALFVLEICVCRKDD